jgi:hypothetical protein
MAEELTFTTPPSISGYRVFKLVLDWDLHKIKVHLRNTSNNVYIVAGYEGNTALVLMNQLNTMNLSTNSLHKRILERLATDGKLAAGTVTGTPDV